MKLQRLAIVLICLALCGFSPLPSGSGSGGGGGSGTVTSLTCGTGITCSPSTITTTGSVTPTAVTGFVQNEPFVLNSNSTALTANVQTQQWHREVSWSLTNIWVAVKTADASHNCDIGFYNTTGTTLLAHTGPLAISSTGFQSYAVTGGPITMPAGDTMFAIACATGITAVIDQPDGSYAPGINTNAGSYSSGLPASVTALALNPNIGLFWIGTN